MDTADNIITAGRQTMYKCIKGAAEKTPDKAAVIVLDKEGRERIATWSMLCAYTDNMADFLEAQGVTKGSRVAVALPNSLAAVVATLAVWRLGACAFLLSSELVSSERKCLLDQIKPSFVATGWKDTAYPVANITDDMLSASVSENAMRADVVPKPGKATATGGSTGIPKIIIEEAALVFGDEDFRSWSAITGQVKGQTQLVCGSLHHSLFNNSFYLAMAMGNTNVLLSRFDEALAVKAIEKYKISGMVLVPTMMSRIIRCNEIKNADISSLETMHHAGAACPVWLKKEWIDLIGAKKVHEFYSMSEKVGMTHIRGDEWLLHEGSVGTPAGAEIEILDDEGAPVPAGVVGNVYFVGGSAGTTHYLLKDQNLAGSRGNAVSVGDLGYLDEGGYLYLVDRRSDMIVSGGKNIYAAEVENALREYSLINDIVVIGLPDPTWGRKVHALIEPACEPEKFDIYEFTNFGFKHMSNYKLPKTIELVKALPRDGSGKLRRKNLVDEREREPDAPKKFGYINVPNGHQLYAWKAKRAKGKGKKSE